LLYAGLRRNQRYTASAGWLRFSMQLIMGIAIMSLWLWWIVPQLNWLSLQHTPWLRVAYVLGICATGGGLYFATLAACGLKLRAFARRV
jgi:putative peptidoglycan lipid II flippase